MTLMLRKTVLVLCVTENEKQKHKLITDFQSQKSDNNAS